MKAVSFAAGRLYLLLLHLYPRTFSERFAGDMFADFRDGYTEARRRGAWATNAFVGRSFGDLAVSLVSQWRASAAFAIWGASVLVALAIWTGALLVASLEWTGGPATMWFAMQVGVALTTGAMLTIGIALRLNNPS